MAEVDMYGLAEINVERLDNETGDIVLTLRGEDGTIIRIDCGRFHDEAEELREMLYKASKGVFADIIDGWEDRPDEHDGWVIEDRDGYIVQLEGLHWNGEELVSIRSFPSSQFRTFPTRDIATYELAAAMTATGCFPNAWFQNERGNTEDIGHAVRAFHDAGGTDLLPLEGVVYAEGDEIIVDGDPYVSLVKDYGTELGVAYICGGVRCHAEHKDVEHVHVWGDLETSRLAGTVHRKCEFVGCNVINALDDDEEETDDDQ